MPELPEVETVVRGLRSRVVGLTISRVDITGHKVFRGKTVNYTKDVENRSILNVTRHGKFILLELSPCVGKPSLLQVHLGMSGRLELLPLSSPLKPHTHIVFHFGSSPFHLRYRDVRRFGWLELVSSSASRFSPPDALTAPMDEIFQVLRSRRGFLKNVLLDQNVLAGLGNIYVDEILHRAGLHPRGRLERCADKALLEICRHMRRVLSASVKAGGTSFRDYVNAEGKKGRYSRFLRVYGRAGQPCACGKLISKIIVAGRGTHFCPGCQPRKKTRLRAIASPSLN